MESKEAVMPLSGHLSELRWRLLISLVMLAIGMVIRNVWLDEIMAFLTAPAGKLYFMKPAKAFCIFMVRRRLVTLVMRGAAPPLLSIINNRLLAKKL